MVIDLHVLWDQINREHWAGRLPTPQLEFGRPDSEPVHAATRWLPGGGLLVRVSPESASVPGLNQVRWTRDVLRHESIHVAMGRPRVGDGHGRGFRRHARRIGRQLGLPAPVSFRSWPATVRPETYYTTIEIGARSWNN